MSMFNTKLHNARVSLRDEAKRQIALANMLRANAPEIKQIWEMVPPKLRSHVYISAQSFDYMVRLSLPMRDLDGFKDKRLTKLLEKFADWTAETRDYTYDTPNRDYHFERKYPHGLNVKFSVYAYVKSDSPTCRIVVKGVTTKVVEEEIREIVCE